LTEARATFSLDAATRTPRESLKNGLTMLVSLASQLGFPKDESLAQDVLDYLLEERVQVLSACLQEFEKPSVLSNDWDSFWSSIQLTLMEELTSIKSAK